MNLSSCVSLNNGVEMPRFGLGLSHNGFSFSRETVLYALEKGIRLLDTAKVHHLRNFFVIFIGLVFSAMLMRKLSENA